jgi:hypothetical protein
LKLAYSDEDIDRDLATEAICAACTLDEIVPIETQPDNEKVKYPGQLRDWFKFSEAISIETSLTSEGHSAQNIQFFDSPFDELDEHLTNDEKIKNLIEYVREESNIQFANELAVRLDFLRDAVNEDSDEIPISTESLRNFISFLRKTPNLKYPNVVLTPSNEIRAQWRTASNRHFAVVFLPTEETRYVIFTPNPKEPDKIDRLSGITSVGTLMETVQPHKVLEWASE